MGALASPAARKSKPDRRAPCRDDEEKLDDDVFFQLMSVGRSMSFCSSISACSTSC
jgi:hypothetical protein